MLSPEIGFAEVSVGERRNDIRRMLLERRCELLNEIHSRVRDVREVGSHHHHPIDPRDAVDAEPEDDLVFALIQMKTEMLEKINQAIHHFDEGTYGNCVDCGDAIALSRLRALPFAVRCRDCAETREGEHHRERIQLQRAPSGLGVRHRGRFLDSL